jgi:hypothetical protein
LVDVPRGIFITERLAHRSAIANEWRVKKFTVTMCQRRARLIFCNQCRRQNAHARKDDAAKWGNPGRRLVTIMSVALVPARA